jgi:hypothetical protein
VDKEDNHQKGTSNTNVGGDQNVISGQNSGNGIIITGGHANVVTIHQFRGPDAEELTALFETINQHIQSRPPDPNVDKEEILDKVQKIQAEVSKGEEANQTKLGRWMEDLNKIAPDIIDVALASLGGPVSGITAVLKKIADHAHQQTKA